MSMYQGNWKCSGCGGTITELPFQPRSTAGLTCRACYGKQKEVERSEQPVPEMQPASEPMPSDGIPDFDESFIATEPPPMDGGLADLAPATPSSNNGSGKISGSWQCSMCGGEITSLPFTPRNASNLKCLDCFKQSKQ